MRTLRFLVLGLFLLPAMVLPAQAQQRNRQALEREKKQNLERMAEIRSVLKKTTSEKEVTLGQLKALNQQIKAQTEQIELLNEDLQLTDSEIAELRQQSQKLTGDLTRLKKQYADMIVRADRRRQQLNPLGFLFAADNFNQLIARYRYLKQYSNARQGQVKQIEEVQAQIKGKQVATERKRRQQKTTITAKVSESKKLENLKGEQDKVVKQLSQKESQLRDELAESRRSVARLESMITRIIAREARERAAREARERAERERLARVEAARKAAERKRAEEAAAREKPTEDRPITEPAPEKEVAKVDVPEKAEVDARRDNNLNDAEMALASSFAASRRRLPWPVQRGFVSDRFGVHKHPVLGINISNPGIDIQTNAGETVRSVYEGVVMNVEYVMGSNNVVAIQHGDYFTIYAKLKSVSVRVGQRVKAREPIGVVATDAKGISELQFQVWKEFAKMNPETWLAPR
ncbi:peptidoglycan DD-metalloendopeptidase family protein [Rudanella paleaurantiibacter]|uniref:Peptidoglycan DD-metalloendopeptidase family protein n=2 Tax=Rudanella paleaurantiibacter TaxID=2614655 RepID=A0A7J5TXP9_9BACT|nr:peptidoglycan DD-metalloendopeptidase family protein [Rudanella paleaurantiibacter]